MKLSDKEILELNELCNALLDGTLSDKQKARLGEFLRASSEACQFYVRVMGLSASLIHYAGEMQTAVPERVAGREKIVPLFSWILGDSQQPPACRSCSGSDGHSPQARPPNLTRMNLLPA